MVGAPLDGDEGPRVKRVPCVCVLWEHNRLHVARPHAMLEAWGRGAGQGYGAGGGDEAARGGEGGHWTVCGIKRVYE